MGSKISVDFQDGCACVLVSGFAGSGFGAECFSQNYFSDMGPAGVAPAEVGKKLAEHFLTSRRSTRRRFFMPRQERGMERCSLPS